jgi:hypothetical protein
MRNIQKIGVGKDLIVPREYPSAGGEPLYLVRRTLETDWPSRSSEQFRNWSQR